MPKVSVIVPIYNVEHYLNRGIESLIRQTLTDIEIILIDDGSTDSSGRICDAYAAQDARIRVIHKQNQGLSSARNNGIEAATAPYIMFMDGDDWVRPVFCEKPYQEAIRNDADLVIFRAYCVKNGKIRREKKAIVTGIIDAETATRYGGVQVWNKLYKQELFSGIRYPEDRMFEDVAVTHKLVFAAARILRLPDILYYWSYRKESISHCRCVKNKRDGFISALQRADDLKKLRCEKDLYMPMLLTYALGFLARAEPGNDPVFKQAEDAVDAIKGIPTTLNWKKKLLLIVWRMDKRLFHFLCSTFEFKNE